MALDVLNVNELCRFCLSITSEEKYVISEDSDVLRKIKTCLLLEILLCKTLPSRICYTCVDKLEEIYNYHKKVSENQEIYLKLLQENYSQGVNLRDNEFIAKNYGFENFNSDSNFSGKVSVRDESYLSSDDELLSEIKQNKENSYNTTLAHHSTVKDTEKIVKNTDNYPHKCLTCFKYCKSQNDLIKHYTKHRDDINNEKLKAVDDEKFVKKILDGGTQVFECSSCSKIFNELADILKHVEDHWRPFTCKVCGRTYKSVYEIIRHGRAHNGQIFVCTLGCGFSSVYKGALKEHERRHGTPEFKYTCGKCGKGFQVKTWHDQHQNIHSGEKPYVCDICGVAFHMDSIVTAVRLIVSIVQSKHRIQLSKGHNKCLLVGCSHAGLHIPRPKITGYMSVLNVHKLTPKRNRPRYLTAHRSKKHPQTSAVRKYVCVTCSLPCDSRNSLTKHNMEIHGIKVSLLCDQCGKVFTSSELLKYHKNRHLGVKPYDCSVCNKKFVKKFNLKIHEHTHTGARAYVCLHCGKTFTQNSALRRHKRRYHPESQLKEKNRTGDSKDSRIRMESVHKMAVDVIS